MGHTTTWQQARSFSQTNLPPHSIVKFPALNPTMSKGEIVGWLKKEGEKVLEREPIVRIQTDKCVIDFDLGWKSGYLAKILVPFDVTIDVGVPIAILVDTAADIKAFANYARKGNWLAVLGWFGRPVLPDHLSS